MVEMRETSRARKREGVWGEGGERNREWVTVGS